MPQLSVLNSSGSAVTIETLPPVGPANKANSLPVQLPTDGDPIPTVAFGFARVIGSNIVTRQANTTAYAAGQVVGGASAAGFTSNGFTFTGIARVAGGLVQLNRARLYKSNPTALGAFELALFRAQPTLSVGDTGTFASGVPLGNAGAAARLVARFAFDMTGALVGSDGAELAAAPITGTPALVQLPGGASDLFGVLRTTSSYNPLSGEQFSVVLEGYAF